MSRDKLQFLSPLFLKYQNDFEKNPRSRVFAPLAEAYRKVGMTEKAMEILSQGIRFNPNYVMGYLGLAFCYSDLKQYNLAYSTLRPLVESNRDNIRLQRLFTDCCISIGNKEEALDTLKYLLFINPKDKEVAGLVTTLEREVEEKYYSAHKPIIIPPERFSNEEDKSPNIFEVNRLSSTPVVDFDDWLQIDLQQKEKNEPATISKIESWNVKNISTSQNNKPLIKVEEEIKPINVITQIETIDVVFENEKIEDAPIVTHTLVDLYCGQGHIEKALEILEKILILNPKDLKTIEKIKEIKLLMNYEDEDTNSEVQEEQLTIEINQVDSPILNIGRQMIPIEIIESDKEKTMLELVDLEDVNNASEEDGRRQLMSILEEKVFASEVIEDSENLNSLKLIKKQKIEAKLSVFLKKIHQRALDYQNRI